MINHAETGCLIPFFQSLVAGALTGATVTGFVLWLVYEDPRWLILSISAGAALWWFSGSIQHHRRAMYGEFEQVAAIPQMQPVTDTVRVEFSQDNQIQIANIPATPGQLHDLSTGILAGMTFAESSWCGEGRPFSRNQFRTIRGEFISRGWLRQRNPEFPNQGFEVSPSGRAVLRRLAQK